MGTDPTAHAAAADALELVNRARQGGGRVLAELDRWASDLSKPWPHVAPESLAEGRDAIEQAAESLRKLLQSLDRKPST
jgi:hypothetical protein